MTTKRHITRIGWHIVLYMVAVCFVAPSVVTDSLKPIVLDPSYSHDGFDTMPQDIVRHFRAFTTSFDSADGSLGRQVRLGYGGQVTWRRRVRLTHAPPDDTDNVEG